MAIEGQYQDSKINITKIPRIVCIMPIFVRDSQIEEYSVRSNQNPDLYFPFKENKLESIKFTLACYEHYKAGIDYELILVNNGTKDPETLKFLDDLPYKVYHRENRGFSFGAHKWAWERFRDDNLYDYYLFHEQDWGPAKDNWLRDILFKFLEDKEVGAVGNVVESRPTEPIGNIGNLKQILGLKRDYMFNLDGCYTFTSAKILKEVDKYGGLKVLECEPVTNLDASYNEILFQQPIMELGYKLTSFHKQNYLQVSGISIGDLNKEQEKIPFEKITPIIQGNIRFFSERMKRYFGWYLAPEKTVFIIGLHRSGTSMTSHICSMMGMSIGKNDCVMGADSSNEDGYWENRDFTELNDDILKAAGGCWYAPPSIEEVQKVVSLFKERVSCLINKHKDIIWGIKDPRLVFTYPAYLPFLSNLELIITKRNIDSIIKSILKIHSCNLPLEYNTERYMKILCNKYLDAIENMKKSFNYIIIEFERYFDRPDDNIDKLIKFFDYKGEKEQFKQIISHNYRHF